jgi:SAM-dependent methyltransferase
MEKSLDVASVIDVSPYNIGRLRCIADLIPPTHHPLISLDIGCGTGIAGMIAGIVIKKGYTYMGVDISKDTLSKFNRIAHTKHECDVHLLQADACSLPLKHGLKLVMALEVIEHVNDPNKLLVEIDNILVEGGYLIISTPNKLSLEGFKGKIQELVAKKRWSAGNIEHKYIFSSSEFLSLLKQRFLVLRVLGYYFPPKIPFTEEIEGKWWFGSHLRFSGIYQRLFNMLGFQTIALLKKVRKK